MAFQEAKMRGGWLSALLGVASLGLGAWAWERREWRGLVGEWQAGEMKRLEVLVPGAWWWGAVCLGVILGGLALTARWWRGPWQVVGAAAEGKVARWFWVVLVGLMALGLAVRLPRMGLSFYNDEAYSFRRHVAGAMTPEREGRESHFRPVRWVETCYQNAAGNNSLVFSVLARVSYDGWRRLSGQGEGAVKEWVVRLPVLVCGVLAIGAMGVLGYREGGARLGVLAGLLTALHPWMVRYSSEARCYGILMLLMPGLFLALREALRTGRWRAWLAVGALEYATVGCFFGAAHFLVGLNGLLVGGAVLKAWRERDAGRWQRARGRVVPLGVSGLLAAGVYLALHLPLFLQTARLVADETYMHHPFTREWFQDAGSFLVFGMPGLSRVAEGGVPVSLWGWWEVSSAMTTAVVSLAVGLLGWGAGRLWRRGGAGGLLVGASLAGAGLTLAYCYREGLGLLPWYSIFLLPGVLLCLAAGLEGLWCGTWEVVGPLPTGSALALVLAAWGVVLPVYLGQSRENLRGVVEVVRGRREVGGPLGPGEALLGVFWSEVAVYDRSAVVLRWRADLEALMARARREGRECYVNASWRAFVMKDPADEIRAVEDGGLFERVAFLPGLDEPGNGQVVWRMKAGGGGTNSPGGAGQGG